MTEQNKCTSLISSSQDYSKVYVIEHLSHFNYLLKSHFNDFKSLY